VFVIKVGFEPYLEAPRHWNSAKVRKKAKCLIVSYLLKLQLDTENEWSGYMFMVKVYVETYIQSPGRCVDGSQGQKILAGKSIIQ
jgi:hypothetical protein